MRTVEQKNKNLDWMVSFLVGANVVTIPREQKLLTAPVEDMLISRSKKFYDVNSSPDGDIEKVFREEAVVSDTRKRIVRADEYSESRIDQDDWNWNEHADAERQATMNAFELAKNGSNLVVWIGPEGGSYVEGRLNIYLPVFKNGEWSLQGYGIPLLKNQSESLKLGKKLIDNGGNTIGNIEDLRCQPIGFKVEDQKEWLHECQKLMPEFKDLWKFIADGGEEKNKEKVLKAVLYAKEKARGNNVSFETIMARQGFLINAVGGHGTSYGTENVYKFKIEMVNGEPYTELQRINGKLICPVCGEEVGEGVTVCPKCKVNLR